MDHTRRRWICATCTWLTSRAVLPAEKEDFWNRKDPSTWSQDEKQVLLQRSPWARAGVVRMEVDKKRLKENANGRKGAEIPYTRPDQIPGSQTVPFGEKPPPVPNTDTGAPVEFGVLARWETATPVRLSGAPELPDVSGDFYVLRLRGLPLMPPPKRDERMLQAIKDGSRLERKDKPAIPCDHLFTGSGDAVNQVLLFFRRGTDPIQVSEKFVTLESWFGPFHLSVRFALKEMMYKGQLAL